MKNLDINVWTDEYKSGKCAQSERKSLGKFGSNLTITEMIEDRYFWLLNTYFKNLNDDNLLNRKPETAQEKEILLRQEAKFNSPDYADILSRVKCKIGSDLARDESMQDFSCVGTGVRSTHTGEISDRVYEADKICSDTNPSTDQDLLQIDSQKQETTPEDLEIDSEPSNDSMAYRPTPKVSRRVVEISKRMIDKPDSHEESAQELKARPESISEKSSVQSSPAVTLKSKGNEKVQPQSDDPSETQENDDDYILVPDQQEISDRQISKRSEISERQSSKDAPLTEDDPAGPIGDKSQDFSYSITEGSQYAGPKTSRVERMPDDKQAMPKIKESCEVAKSKDARTMGDTFEELIQNLSVTEPVEEESLEPDDLYTVSHLEFLMIDGNLDEKVQDGEVSSQDHNVDQRLSGRDSGVASDSFRQTSDQHSIETENYLTFGKEENILAVLTIPA